MPTKKSPDYYAILGVSRDATQNEIKQAYFASAQRLHPDKNKLAGETEIFLDVQLAFETLSNPKKRAKYDATLPPVEKTKLPANIKILYSRPSLVRQDEPQIIYVLLEVSPPQQTDDLPAPPLNVCLILDRSTSMKGEKMDTLKAAASQVLRGLRPQDAFSVIAFSDRAEVLIPATQAIEKSKLEARIQMIQPFGATEIFQGLDAGYQEISRHLSPTRINHIILMTDGHTYGDENKCLQLANRASEQGIVISVMGIGKEWNDVFLDEIASKTGGSSRYIIQAQDIKNFLLEKFESLANTYADNIILKFENLPGADLSYAFRTQPEAGLLPIESPIHLGPILQDTSLFVLFEYHISPELTKKDKVKFLTGSIKISVAAMPTQMQPIPFEFSCAVSKDAVADPPPPIIIQSLGKLTLYRLQDKARNEVEAGQFELAARHLNQLATNLLSQGERSLAQTVLMEVDNIHRMNSLSEDGQKTIKYGTRSLLLNNQKV